MRAVVGFSDGGKAGQLWSRGAGPSASKRGEKHATVEVRQWSVKA